MGCDARRDNPFPDLFLGRDTEVIAINCKNPGWAGSSGSTRPARRLPGPSAAVTAPIAKASSRSGWRRH
jgi:hypothetical protein